MFGVSWDEETGGILLLEREGSILPIVRPVYHEELDLLGFDKYWSYPKVDEPLLWSINRNYYYFGKKVASVHGGGFYSDPQIEILEKNLEIEPVNIKKMVSKNKDLLENAVFQALDFIKSVREKYKKYKAVVGFSGGKDSVVVVDLVQRAIPPDEFIVLFNDTTKELSPTYKYLVEVMNAYPNLQFFVAKYEKSALDLWKVFGPPSRVHRWCCTVFKTLPTLRFMREKFGKNAKILFFDGIRAEESVKRASFDKITKGKNFRQLNVHPTLHWNSAMVYMYIFMRKLPINELYRYGAIRAGCAVCPFESEWWELITWKKYRDEIEPYLEIIKQYAKAKVVRDVENYIRNGTWKGRVGGDGWQKSRVIIRNDDSKVDIYIDGKLENFVEWSKIIGDVGFKGNSILISFKGKDYTLDVEKIDGGFKISTKKPSSEFLTILKLVASKSAYCASCRACEFECPKEAISFNKGVVKIDNKKCTHCKKCTRVAQRGCLVADSLKVKWGVVKDMGLKKLGSYKHFGIREGWMREFFENPEKWWVENSSGKGSLGPAQFESMRRWLSEAEIFDTKNGVLTETGKLLREIGVDDDFTWAVIWTNLARNSGLISWYLNLEWGRTYTRDELLDLMGDDLSLATRKNGLQSLVELLEKSPIGERLRVGVAFKKGRTIEGIEKMGFISGDFDISIDAVLYSLYRLKEEKESEYFSIRYLYENSVESSPYRLFGIPEKSLEKILRSLQENYGREWISVEISADLDNISLNPNKTSIDVIRLHLENKKP